MKVFTASLIVYLSISGNVFAQGVLPLESGNSYSTYGNTTYGSDGTTSSRYGNTIYGSGGGSCSTYGNTTYCY